MTPGSPPPAAPPRHAATLRASAAMRLLGAPLLFLLGAAAVTFAAASHGARPLGLLVLGAVLGGWTGMWLAYACQGRADLRWALPLLGVFLGPALAGIDPKAAGMLAGATLLLAWLLRTGLQQRFPRHEWSDPAVAAILLASLAASSAPLAWLAVRVLPAAVTGWSGAWAAVALGAVGACAIVVSLAPAEERDPFDVDTRRQTLLLSGLALVVGGALAVWAPSFSPLLVVGLLALAAAGRPRTVAVLGAVIAFAATVLADFQPGLLSRMLGGWSAPAGLALLAASLGLAVVGSLLVHQRDRVRARLRAASGHLLTLAEKSPGLVATFDRERRHLFFNDAYRRWTGLPRERLDGAPLADVLGPALGSSLGSSIGRAMAGASQQMQVATDDARVLDVRLEPYFGLEGAIAGFHLLAEDVTWRGQSERDIRALVAAAPEPTLVLDESGSIQLHNDAATRLFGADANGLVGTALTSWLSEAGARRGDPEASDGGLRARRRDGTTFPVELRLGSMPGEHGGRSVVALRDLTPQRALEDAARHAREQAQATLDSISDALVVVDPVGTITAFNPAACALTGWSAEDAVGRAVEEVVKLVDPDKGAARPSVLREVLRTGRSARPDGEIELVRRDGAHRAIEESASPLRDRVGNAIGGVLMFHDVTHVREQAQALSHMAQHDFLTGLPNRVLFQDRLTQALATIAQGGKGAVLYIDLDKFKPINDTLGHPVGDKVLQEVSSRLQDCVRADDTVSRQGGDEFCLLLQRLADPRDAARVAEKLIHSVQQPIVVDGHELRVGASVGISLYPQDGRDARVLMKQADTALYHVKETGRGRYSYFTDLMGERAEARIRVEHDLRFALANDDFVLDYQPVIDSASGTCAYAEALLRWRQMDGCILLPKEFLSVAEETGLIVQIDEWVLDTACLQNALWQREGLPRWPVSVNVSLARFDPARLLGQVRHSLALSGLAPEWLEIEFRGDQLLAQGEKGRALVADLRQLGVRVAVDDIATSGASIADLADLGLDALKLDLSVVGALPQDDRAQRIAQAVCRMGRALGYPVIAKGVESEIHRELLTRWGCEYLQGSLVGPPMSAELLPAMLGMRGEEPKVRRA